MSLAEMAALAAGANSAAGVSCPRCGCRDFRVDKTNDFEEVGYTFRREVCRHCGQPIITKQPAKQFVRAIEPRKKSPEIDDNELL